MDFITNNTNLLKAISAIGAAAAITLPAPVAAQDVEEKPDGSWVSLSGKVASHTPEAFTLDYGEGTITVETDDWDTIGDGWAISEGDKVTVYGRVDDGLYQDRKIEAGSVYIEDLNTMVTAPSPADEEDPLPLNYTYLSVPADYDIQVVGTVTSVSGREFTIDTGERQVSVDTLQMGFNPLDDVGFVQVEEGDFVSVSGDLDMSVFDETEISAETIVKYY
ncbi:NirD/YgiW/YdeI family stress tolerance protein [Marinobacter orientalis]|uniref:NirD/YgiW/YdeI family stress tolerance protein n=1 Tax=Marinobacter orientalis TaxID=1928859 RepID=A0A7Y0WTP4_9GAMM|nr:NirD/YgiW/YdeI family stress tolerance protein [Marinobacter orientalis]NMT65124.1 NirD/YgiW/YdeI family stress tolerance protein [Marinobacter orientalis]TGX48931.1 NirD/YgiW/YdeI family stress tolerance protein [Marinobacter orientalis]